MRWIIGVGVLVLAVLGYGYWHHLTHGAVNVSIYLASDENAFQLLRETILLLC